MSIALNTSQILTLIKALKCYTPESLDVSKQTTRNALAELERLSSKLYDELARKAVERNTW